MKDVTEKSSIDPSNATSVSQKWNANADRDTRSLWCRAWNSNAGVFIGHFLQGVIGVAACRMHYLRALGETSNRAGAMLVSYDPNLSRAETGVAQGGRTLAQARIADDAEQCGMWNLVGIFPSAVLGLIGHCVGKIVRAHRLAASNDRWSSSCELSNATVHEQGGPVSGESFDEEHSFTSTLQKGGPFSREEGLMASRSPRWLEEYVGRVHDAVAWHLLNECAVSSVMDGLNAATLNPITDAAGDQLDPLQAFRELCSSTFQSNDVRRRLELCLALTLLVELHFDQDGHLNDPHAFSLDVNGVFYRFWGAQGLSRDAEQEADAYKYLRVLKDVQFDRQTGGLCGQLTYCRDTLFQRVRDDIQTLSRHNASRSPERIKPPDAQTRDVSQRVTATDRQNNISNQVRDEKPS